jgi:hypothetical protein
MADRIRVIYRTMRCSIPEGGEVVLHVPEHIGVESLEMAAECIALQMRIFKRHAEMANLEVPKEPTNG